MQRKRDHYIDVLQSAVAHATRAQDGDDDSAAQDAYFDCTQCASAAFFWKPSESLLPPWTYK